jgi:hypothetical protein
MRAWRARLSQVDRAFYYARNRAQARKLDWDMTLVEVREAYERQGGRCLYFGIPLDAGVSVDRIDPGRGYVAGNWLLVSRAANYAKCALPWPAFVELHRAIKLGIQGVDLPPDPATLVST